MLQALRQIAGLRDQFEVIRRRESRVERSSNGNAKPSACNRSAVTSSRRSRRVRGAISNGMSARRSIID